MLTLHGKNGGSFVVGGKSAKIVNGPGKYDLSVALFQSGAYEHLLRPEFVLSADDLTTYGAGGVFHSQRTHQTCTIKVSITSVEREDGSGEKWNIRGHLTTFNGVEVEYVNVKFYYCSGDRKGTLTF